MRFYCAAIFLLSLLTVSQATFADEAVEYRTISLIDGTTHRGVVVDSDANNIRLKTLDDEESIPIEDIIQIQTITRATYLALEGRRLLYFGILDAYGEDDFVRDLDASMKKALTRDDLLVMSPSDLDRETTEALSRCGNFDCRLNILRTQNVRLVYGELEPGLEGNKVTFSQLDRNMNHVRDVTIVLRKPAREEARITRTAALILDETPKPLPSQSTSPPEKVVAAKEPRAAEAVEQTEGPSAPGTPLNNAEEVNDEALARARKLDLLPVPGASSIWQFRNLPAAATSVGVVAALTGTVVFLAGDMRHLGMEKGLSVNWTYEERGFNDAALLTGTGVATYLISTYAMNQVVGRIVRKRARKGTEVSRR